MNQRIYVLSPELIIVFLIDEWTSYFMKVLNGLGGFLKNKKRKRKASLPRPMTNPKGPSFIKLDIFTLLFNKIQILNIIKVPSGLAVNSSRSIG
jgi:hypothetical protein